ncbi:YceI family protein [Asticcacaulis sp. AND118]|uniref:YceI family protein n=1 Tax=Asticcacaulis sp. AND118 TaxID=2840468 RepID=UPI001CFF7041|nr:YceI family protein [Asticcacaulis sp. AND118]UDF02192.1 YceI family protein [Asticcacaulis sp. AND118]
MTSPQITPNVYHRASRYLHWAMAALIFYMVFLGWTLEDKDGGLFSRYQMHKSVGFLILLLTVVRIGLRVAYKAPAEIEGPKWQMWAARAVHIAFYVLMIGLPLSGWALVSTAKVPVPTLWFGVLPIPHLPLGHETHAVFENLHGIFAKLIFYVLIPLHVGAALMHHFIHKDDTVTRMLPGLEPKPTILQSALNVRWLVPAVAVVGAFVLATFMMRGARAPEPAPVAAPEAMESVAETSPEAGAVVPEASSASSTESAASSTDLSTPVPVWAVNKSASHINFATTFNGEAIKGGFGSYTADIAFDPERLDQSGATVVIDLASVNSGDSTRDDTLKSDSFFNTAASPKATFKATNFTRTGTDRYVAKGRLTLHGQTKPFDLPFTLKINGKQAVMTATAKLNRLDYGVGTGEWAATDAVPNAVSLDLKVTATTK